jgi:hypothetical protein
MNCQRIAEDELVERYLNGQLEDALQDDLEVHILECPHCLERAEALRLARASLAERAPAIRSLPAKGTLQRRLGWVGIAAALVAVCGITWYQYRSGSHRPKPQANVDLQSLHPVVPAVPPQEASPAGTQEPDAGAHVAVNTHTPGEKHPTAAGTNKKRESTAAAEIAANAGREQSAADGTTASQGAAEQHGAQESGSAAAFAARYGTSPTQMSEDQAVELYSLAAVQPPAFSFAGLAKNSKAPSGANSSASQGFAVSSSTGHVLFQNAMLAYVEKRYGDAADSLETVLEGEPKAADANFYLGICKIMQGRPRDSIGPFKAVLAAPPGTLTQAGHFYLAKAYLQLNNLMQAEEEMQAAAAMPGRLTADARSLAARIQALRQSTGANAGSGNKKPD